MDHKAKWKRFAIIAVSLIGLGVTIVAEATIIKSQSPDGFDLGHMALWFWTGLAGIVSINAGISFMAESVKQRLYYEMKEHKVLQDDKEPIED
ncbi:MAG: hypothetical protein LAT67_03700 [Balneolales bacterium]|nr:hypothetical protein [Balneolales bacterium]